MILATQGCNRVYFTESDDVLEVQGRTIVLVRQRNGKVTNYVMGGYASVDRAIEVFHKVVMNIDAGGIIFPDE